MPSDFTLVTERNDTLVVNTSPITLVAANAGPQGAAGTGAGAIVVDWAIKRDTSNATTQLDPIGNFAAWEAAAPAYWGFADGDRVGFNDRITPTQSGVYLYTAGVGFTRTTDADTYDKLNGAIVVGKTNRHHTDLSTVSGTPAYLELLAVFIPRTVDVIGTVAWDADWFVDRKSYEVALQYSVDQAALRQAAVAVARGSYLGTSGAYTMTVGTSSLGIFGSHGTITVPAVSAASGQRIAITTATNAVTIATQGSDAFLPAANTSFSISAGTSVSMFALPGLPYWWLEATSGPDVDIPFWNGASIATGSAVVMGGAGIPRWDGAIGLLYDATGYTANWAGSAPTNVQDAINRISAAVASAHGPIA